MTLFHLFLIAAIQGITEFLPISSSGHLVLLPGLTGWEDQGLAIDVAVHVGTLFAVIIFFWADVKIALAGLVRLMSGRMDTAGAHLALCLIVATIPVVIVGGIVSVTGIEDTLRSVAVIGWSTLLFGLLLWWTDQKGEQGRSAPEWTLRHAITMGLWQVLALIPGASRSGVTISGARALGYDRRSAARLAMLMSIPTIVAAGALKALDLAGGESGAAWRDAGIAAGLSFFFALLALALMMRLLRSVSFTPYVIYRILLGVGLLIWAYT